MIYDTVVDCGVIGCPSCNINGKTVDSNLMLSVNWMVVNLYDCYYVLLLKEVLQRRHDYWLGELRISCSWDIVSLSKLLD